MARTKIMVSSQVLSFRRSFSLESQNGRRSLSPTRDMAGLHSFRCSPSSFFLPTRHLAKPALSHRRIGSASMMEQVHNKVQCSTVSCLTVGFVRWRVWPPPYPSQEGDDGARIWPDQKGRQPSRDPRALNFAQCFLRLAAPLTNDVWIPQTA